MYETMNSINALSTGSPVAAILHDSTIQQMLKCDNVIGCGGGGSTIELYDSFCLSFRRLYFVVCRAQVTNQKLTIQNIQ